MRAKVESSEQCERQSNVPALRYENAREVVRNASVHLRGKSIGALDANGQCELRVNCAPKMWAWPHPSWRGAQCVQTRAVCRLDRAGGGDEVHKEPDRVWAFARRRAADRALPFFGIDTFRRDQACSPSKNCARELTIGKHAILKSSSFTARCGRPLILVTPFCTDALVASRRISSNS